MAEKNADKTSDRYELHDLFPNESSGVLSVFKIVGGVIIVALIVLALSYPFFVEG